MFVPLRVNPCPTSPEPAISAIDIKSRRLWHLSQAPSQGAPADAHLTTRMHPKTGLAVSWPGFRDLAMDGDRNDRDVPPGEVGVVCLICQGPWISDSMATAEARTFDREIERQRSEDASRRCHALTQILADRRRLRPMRALNGWTLCKCGSLDDGMYAGRLSRTVPGLWSVFERVQVYTPSQ